MNGVICTENQEPMRRQSLYTGPIDKTKPVTNLAPGTKLRLRLRAMEINYGYVKGPEGITRHILLDFPDHWELYHLPEGLNAHKEAE